MWTIDAARKWPNATFVGFDLVNVQFPINHLEPHVGRRITWEYGNLSVNFNHVTDDSPVKEISLSTQLPFEDDTFDLVHISHISKGVPEHKVSLILRLVSPAHVLCCSGTPSSRCFS